MTTAPEALPQLLEAKKELLSLFEKLIETIQTLPNLPNEALSSFKTEVKEKLGSVSGKLKEMSDLKAISNEQIILPKFGSTQDFNIEAARLTIQPFDGKANQKFKHFFAKLSNFIESYKLDERAAKYLLLSLVQSEPFELAHKLREDSFKDIITALADRYSTSYETDDAVYQLDSFTRNSQESLQSAIRRLKIMIDKSSHLFPKDQIESRKNHILTHYLPLIASNEAKQEIAKARRKVLKLGLTPTFQFMYDIALDCEKNAEFTQKHYSSHAAQVEYAANYLPEIRERPLHEVDYQLANLPITPPNTDSAF